MNSCVLKVAPSLSSAQIEKIEREFSAMLGQELDFTVMQDSTLIGGFCAFIDGKVYDASLGTKLNALTKTLYSD